MSKRALLGFVLLSSLTRSTWATEGAASYYFPGCGNAFAVAVAPEPGWIAANSAIFLGSSAERSSLQGRINSNMDMFAVYNMFVGAYAWEKPMLGGRLSVSGFVPIAYAKM